MTDDSRSLSDQIRQRLTLLRQQRQVLVTLQGQNLGELQLDVEQALVELDDLLQEGDRLFPTTVTPDA
ncbi:hypothetical protein [Synechococcus elongatus]|uniref:Uncharacterized protein n=1 Tax=Synechococcus elongatus (strain ATCC 33912 / PCC 7942 / FACHB-805) TaxID=1140 RepID=Q31N41_SYNE7|nr:hypothetical protein [Synechococcus elongatus]ABB57528.1 hypothetical protein Synpcc7942_1498 [Synechococcus elongatus PCC 7942 = FACHB-805]AJD57876.1 hypothetical protein M744_08485 [Synechococcus elongatus UTEX 2973]MBD2588331.1 hypothetical protein [Synechococcus elongatus FACHB-242]MBD2689506.1 hypothetical protein [Synechococcus elongatus FACHB-1061]MBD2708075.1 hypothetical protein [Synechococcus elongatus PCC 7942 = FACHB-805]